MLPYFVISEILPTFFEKYVGKFAVNQKNVQHRHNSTLPILLKPQSDGQTVAGLSPFKYFNNIKPDNPVLDLLKRPSANQKAFQLPQDSF